MKKIFFIIIIGIFGSHLANAQTMADVLRYSFYNPSGSARFHGVGGAMGAMGADYGAISTNPAGLGAYWTNEFVVSPSILSSTSDSRFANNITEGRDIASLKLNNFGIVFNNQPSRGALKSFNTAIGVNRIADFTQEFQFSGYTNGTIVERFAERANGKAVDNLDLFEADLAYATGAIYSPDENNNYNTDFEPTDFTNKFQEAKLSGGINEVLFGFGGNLSNKLLIGATVGIPIVNFESDKTYIESDDNEDIPFFNSLEYAEYLNTSGFGFNFKGGLIFKLTKDFQIGGSLHSPTYYTLTDNYYSVLTYRFFEDTAQEYTESSPDGSFKYKIQTPWKAMASFGFKKKVGNIAGFINGDIEWIDYRNGNIDLSSFSSNIIDEILSDDINDKIDDQLLSALNFKIGGELAYNKLRFRGGYNLIGSPYGADQGIYFPAFSLGFGWREDKYYLDFGYRNSLVREGYIPYVVLDDSRLQLVENNRRVGNLVMTVGFQF